MKFSIVSKTAGAKVGDLALELRDILEPKVSENYSDIEDNILICITCYPKSYSIKSVIEYDSKERLLEVEVSVFVEDYEGLYKAEQRYYLGVAFLEHLELALDKYPLKGLDKEKFVSDIVKWGKEFSIKVGYTAVKKDNWFSDEIDWGSDLDK